MPIPPADHCGDETPVPTLVTRRFTSGRECWVFSVPAPDDLPGHHPELIASALDPGESLNSLVYSPLFEARGGPFGIDGSAGSHAVAVTPRRLLVSRDPHQDGIARSVRSIPFDRILWIELGEALVLGWLVVRFAEDGRRQCETVFFRSSGRAHLQAAVRAWRSLAAQQPRPTGSASAWLEVCEGWPPYLRGELPGLVLEQEQALIVFRSSERWGQEGQGKRRRPCCASPSAGVAVSERSLFFVESERPWHPGGLAFGVNVTVVDRKSITECRVENRTAEPSAGPRLVVEVEASGCGSRLELPFDPQWTDQAAHAAAILGRPVGASS